MAIYIAPHSALLFVTLLLLSGAVARCLKQSSVRAAYAAAFLMGSAWVWTAGAFIQQFGPAWVEVGETIRLQGALLLPTSWLVFALYYGGHSLRATRTLVASLTLIPLVFTVMLWTNPWHFLFWSGATATQSGFIVIPEITYGPLFRIHLVYNYTVALLGTSLIIGTLWRVAPYHQKYGNLLFLGLVLPVFVNVGRHLGVTIGGIQDLTPYTFGLTALAFWLGFDSQRWFSVTPAPRDIVLDSLNDSLLVCDSAGRVVDVNTAATTLFGFSTKEVHGQTLHETLASWPALLTALEKEETGDWESDGRHYEVHTSPLRDQNNAESGSLVILRDVSEIQRAKMTIRDAHNELEQRVKERTAELSKANTALVREVNERKRAVEDVKRERDRAEEMSRVKSVFLANMSHEIRTPLTGILGFTQILAMEVKPHLQEFVSAIDHSGRRLLDTLTAVLELSRLQAGHVELKPTSFNLIEELEMILDLFQRRAIKKGVDLNWFCKTKRLEVVLDRGALNCILQNLLANAIKFTEEGSVELVLSVDQNDVMLQVKDTGIGISDSFLPYLFDQFKREQEGINAAYEGSGLGLTLVKHFVDLLEGTIEVESQQPGGTTFTIRLPDILEHPVEPIIPLRPQVEVHEPTQARILVVEDNPTTASFIFHLLKDQYTFDIASNADEAEAMWAVHQYEIVLMDINLGVAQKDGVSLMHSFRKDGVRGEIPFVAMTAYALPGDRERFLEKGFDQYLSKPFDKAHLFSILKELDPYSTKAGSRAATAKKLKLIEAPPPSSLPHHHGPRPPARDARPPHAPDITRDV